MGSYAFAGFQTETQRGGLVFIYNMANSKYSNFDYDLSQKMLTLLKGAYPARLKKVLIVTAPLWFKAPFKVGWRIAVLTYDIFASQFSVSHSSKIQTSFTIFVSK